MANTVDLDNITEYDEDKNAVEKKADAIADLILAAEKDKKPVYFFTGAGISTNANIKDFRGPQGVWTLQAQVRWLCFPIFFFYKER